MSKVPSEEFFDEDLLYVKPKPKFLKPPPLAANEGLTIEDYADKSFLKETYRVFSKNPFICLGMVVTVGALSRGLVATVRGDQLKAQRMMRWRVGGQAFAIFSIVMGSVYYGTIDKSKVPTKSVNELVEGNVAYSSTSKP